MKEIHTMMMLQTDRCTHCNAVLSEGWFPQQAQAMVNILMQAWSGCCRAPVSSTFAPTPIVPGDRAYPPTDAAKWAEEVERLAKKYEDLRAKQDNPVPDPEAT